MTTDVDAFELSEGVSLNQLPKSPREGRVGVDLTSSGSVGSDRRCPAPVKKEIMILNDH